MEKITKINREKGFVYKVDKEGNVIKEEYSLLKDPYTLVTLAIIILGGLYYLQISESVTNANNFDNYCYIYSNLRQEYIINNPGEDINVKNVLKYYKKNKKELDLLINLSDAR